MMRRTAWFLVVLLVFTVGIAWGGAFPEKAVNVYVGYSAGGATDTAARIFADEVNKFLEEPIVVMNKPGAGSAVCADFVSKAEPDGYTLMNATLTTVIQTVVDPNIPFGIDDFTHVVRLYSMPLVIVTTPDSQLKTIEDLISYARKNPMKLNMGVPGINSVHHFAYKLFEKASGVKVTSIPFKGDAPAIVGILGGHVDVAFIGAVAAAEHLKAGKLSGLVTTAPERLASFPELPTMAETGFADAGIVTWGSLFAPAGTPDKVIEKLSATYKRAANSEDLIRKFEKVGFTVSFMDHEAFHRFVMDTQKKLKELVQAGD
jgi:tripartite-type tricarboxylate transporter receptor subunit TctC